jgi:site-specific recombinase XerD
MSEQLSKIETSRHFQLDQVDLLISTFTSVLSKQGFSPASIHCKGKVIRKFCLWSIRRRLKVSELDGLTVKLFFKEQPRAGYVRRGDLAVLFSLLEWFQTLGFIEALSPNIEKNDLDCIMCDFSRHLEDERGLSQATLHNYIPLIRNFLSEYFSSDHIVLSEIDASSASQFVLRHARTMSTRSAQLMTSALRVFFRFLRVRGDISIDLAASVPTVASWQLSEIPKSLSPDEVELVLQSCDRDTTIGKRDYTILLLLARLGLRAGEIVAMTLDDVDWDAGVVTVHGKRSRKDQLPIPYDVGEAIAVYLRQVRPPCETRSMFIRSKAPHRGFSSSVAISNIVHRSLARAGLNPIRKGAHLLRHSLASKMLMRGVCLTEIGDILRHSTINTTEIYAKVDLMALKGLAQPWPGGDV